MTRRAGRGRRAGARSGGQAALEVLACVPVVLAAALVAWQLTALLWAAVRAEEAVRRAALDASAGAATPVTVTGTMPVPGPLGRGLVVTVRARVWAP